MYAYECDLRLVVLPFFLMYIVAWDIEGHSRPERVI